MDQSLNAQLQEITDGSLKTLRGYAAMKRVTDENSARASLTRLDPKLPAAVTCARDVGRSSFGRYLPSKLLPPFTDDEIQAAEWIAKATAANRTKGRRES